MAETKQCSKCKEPKTLDLYHKDSKILSGYKSSCKDCCKLYKLSISNRIQSYSSEYRSANREKISEYNKNYNETYKNNNHEELKARNRIYSKTYSDNNVIARKFRNLDYQDRHPEKIRSIAATRRAKKLNATPPWLSVADKSKINSIYKEAKDLQLLDRVERHVDHIDPLNHHLVCGLHVPSNLRIITAKENISKSNSFTPYVESELT